MTGSAHGFDEFVAARWTRLVRSAVLLGADVHAAEDVVQVALAKCHRRWTRVTRADDVDAYVHRVLINTLLDSRRRRWWGETPTEALPEAGRSVDDVAGAVAESDAMRGALLRLPLGQREVVVLRFYADLTEQQTATALGVALGTIKSRTSRALAALAADESLRDVVQEES
ncbi:SigE family RNA polymerase sigma factor [Nocardioides marinquilinus]|uniref:SigE family RNA polymerase sigma factor n=1 Tax=Nocardioides marinquilinus TaxID=1210400 RepID=A0ABP9PLD2_9ACTN